MYTGHQVIWWTVHKIFKIPFFIILGICLLTQRFQYLVLILTFTLAFTLSFRFDNIFLPGDSLITYSYLVIVNFYVVYAYILTTVKKRKKGVFLLINDHCEVNIVFLLISAPFRVFSFEMVALERRRHLFQSQENY